MVEKKRNETTCFDDRLLSAGRVELIMQITSAVIECLPIAKLHCRTSRRRRRRRSGYPHVVEIDG